MATSLFFRGRVTQVPGTYVEVDASGLDSVGLGATGIVAVLGTAEGGIPVSAITKVSEIPTFRRPEKMQSAYRSGQLREVVGCLFEPAKDDAILGGAQRVLSMKVNPATRAEGALKAGGVDQIDLVSRDYGAFTDQIRVEIATGTNKGKQVTIAFEDVVETWDDVGGDVLATLQYSGGATGWNTALMSINAAGDVTVDATRTGAGASNLVDNPHTGGAAQIKSDSAADEMNATVFGITGGVARKVTVALDGVTPVALGNFDAGGILGVYIDGVTDGVVTVEVTAGGADVFTVPAGTSVEGVIVCDHCHVDRAKLSLVLDGAGTPDVLVFGRDAANGELAEVVEMTGAVAVDTAEDTYALVDFIVVGAVDNARTLTVSARAARSLASVQSTLQKVADYFNAKSVVVAGPTTRGFIFTVLTGKTATPASALDVQVNVNVKAVNGNVTADLYALVAWINVNSGLVSASESDGATTVPDNTASPLFLSGGGEGVALFAHYQAALNLLKQFRNMITIVDLSGDPAVAAAVDAHCAFMKGLGKAERDGVVGLLNTAGDDLPSKTEILTQTVDINSCNIRAWPMGVVRFNSAGEREEFPPQFGAAILAGMQAGSPVGTPLTHKKMNVLELTHHSSWNPTDDAEDLIAGGCVFGEEIDGLGRRIVRNVTTHLASDNIAFVEGSVNHAVNFSVFNFRNALEAAVGEPGFVGTVNATRGRARQILAQLVSAGTITAYRALDLELILDVLDVSVQLAPVVPINFVHAVVHLVTLAQLAAAQAA